MIYVGW